MCCVVFWKYVLSHDAVRATMKQTVDTVRVTVEQVDDAITLA